MAWPVQKIMLTFGALFTHVQGPLEGNLRE